MLLPGHDEQGVAQIELPINTEIPPNAPVNDEQDTVENIHPQAKNINRYVPTPGHKKLSPFSILLITNLSPEQLQAARYNLRYVTK
ncbi:hypothetical protein K3495_g11739 [Podosphaera aphanis]|nr:hypothetical protein K3495_g11739 [Podosphaera aphanis]